MATYSLTAQIREITGKKNYKLRQDNLIPAVLYGHSVKNQNLAVKKKEFLDVYEKTGASHLIDLVVGGAKPVKILVHDLQKDAQTEDITHIDFYQVNANEKIKTEVELSFVGEAPAVKEFGGILMKNFHEVEIECLPADLEKLDKIEVNLSVLKTLDDVIHISDLKVPAGIKILAHAEEAVAMVSLIKEEVEEKPAEAAAAEGTAPEAKEGEAAPEAESKDKEKK